MGSGCPGFFIQKKHPPTQWASVSYPHLVLDLGDLVEHVTNSVIVVQLYLA